MEKGKSGKECLQTERFLGRGCSERCNVVHFEEQAISQERLSASPKLHWKQLKEQSPLVFVLREKN